MKQNVRFWLMQRKWGREILKGKFYRILPLGLCISSFWSDYRITSCQSKIMEIDEQ